MYIQNYTRKKKSGDYITTYIAESYRENGKVKRRHLANLSNLDPELKHVICQAVYDFQNNNLSYNHLEPIQGKSCGALLAFKHLAKITGIESALGSSSRHAKLALFQIIARIVCQGSRLYAVEWSKSQATEEVLDLNYFNEDDLYANLAWLAKNQAVIETKLFNYRHKNESVATIYLYDVTSSYFEGTKNELANWGYNRDKKSGKMQIVIGLLCDNAGYPISVQVFEGNTSDSKTVTDQIKKLASQFSVKNVVMVGDRGMIKEASIEQLTDLNWYYITAITKAQIKTLIDEKVIQLELFTDELIEVEHDGNRYVLHRNPLRVRELEQNRASKLSLVETLCEAQNLYLQKHPKAKVETAINVITAKIAKLKIHKWLNVIAEERVLKLQISEEQKTEQVKLDGCYVIKSNVQRKMASPEHIHLKYKDLALVEQAFRTCKQSIEEIRPIYVRTTSSTRGHVFICMLAYILVKKMSELCIELPNSRKNIIDQLNHLQYIMYKEKNIELKLLPKKLNADLEKIITALKLKLPSHL